MSFFGKYVNVQIKQAHDAVVKAVVSFDPEGATAAQIEQYVRNVDELANIAAKADLEARDDAQKVAALQAQLDQHVRAADLTQQRLVAAGNDPQAQTIHQKALEAIVAEAEGIKANLVSAKAAADDSAGYAKERREQHAEAAQKLLTARQRLESAQRDQERAKREAERMAERKQDALHAAGLASDVGVGDTALDAMHANADRLRQKAAADAMTAGALNPHKPEDAVAAAALAEAAGKPAENVTLSDRLAALKG